MARLNDIQWKEIERRLVDGERAAALALEFGVTRSAISARLKIPRQRKAIELAEQIYELDVNLTKFDKITVSKAYNLAEQMRIINNNMVEGNTHRAKSYAKLSEIAHHHVKKIDHENPDFETLQLVAGITRVGNDVAAPVNAMLVVHKEKLQEAPEDIKKITEIRRTFVGVKSDA